MFTFISNIPIFRRLFLAFVLAAVIPGIIITILGTTFVNGLNTRSQAQQKNLAALHESSRLGNVLTTMAGLRDEVISRSQQNLSNQSQLDELKRNEQDFATSAQQFQQRYQVTTASNMSDVNAILNSDAPSNSAAQTQQDTLNRILGENGLWALYKSTSDKFLHDLQTTPPGSVQTIGDNIETTTQIQPLERAWNTVTEATQQISEVIAQVGPSQVSPITLGTVIAFLSTIMVVIAIGYIVNLTITNPLRDLAVMTRRIAKGDRNARAKMSGRDEISMVATSMNNMLDNIVRLIQETQSQRDVLQSQVEKLVSEVSGVGDGDLRIQAEVTADALGVLADSFNYMVEELSSLVVRVKMVANEVDNSTVTILDSMTQLVKSGDEQIQQINEAAVEIEQVSASSRQVAERSQVLYDVAHDARQDAQVGRQAVLQAVGGMGRINDNVLLTASKVSELGERSHEIDEIVTVISSISHQTNRLALDAAIQAAMAGENGKGFGAVAADIRRLAERAKEQVSSITKIVRSVREEVSEVSIAMQDTERETLSGTRLTQEAGVALESIFTAVERQAREIENINKVAMQQLQSSGAAVQIMRGVSVSTQQSSASTRDTSTNMERLARLVEQLRSSVKAFKLRENQGYFVPNAQVNVALEQEQDNQMTVSGVFRTVNGGTQTPPLANGGFAANALPPPSFDDSFDAFPIMPNQSQSGNGYENGFASEYNNQEQWYNEQPFSTNGRNR